MNWYVETKGGAAWQTSPVLDTYIAIGDTPADAFKAMAKYLRESPVEITHCIATLSPSDEFEDAFVLTVIA